MEILWQVALQHPDEPATFFVLLPDRLPERVVEVALEEADIPVDRNLRTAMAEQFRDHLDRNASSKRIGSERVPQGV